MAEEISLKGMFTLNLAKKEPFFGSFLGMRYRLVCEDGQLLATVYPEPYSWDFTPDEQKKTESFPMTQEGVDQATAWLNKQKKEGFEKS